MWETTATAYERRNRAALRKAGGEAWGLYRIPEAELRLLDPVRRRDVVELGCGAALWSIALAHRGARVAALDFSAARLRQAGQNVRDARVSVALVEGNAERLPFRAGCFDIAFCDWGALFFAEPDRTVPEAARVLRPGGQLVFATGHPLRAVAQSRTTGDMGPRLAYDYFGLGPVPMDSGVEFHRSMGDWVALFRRSGFEIERLLEPRAPPVRTTSYLNAKDHAWGRRWPLEAIWALRKRGGSKPPRTTPRRRPGRRAAGSR
jgi:SAM-dependent methyltransferase